MGLGAERCPLYLSEKSEMQIWTASERTGLESGSYTVISGFFSSYLLAGDVFCSTPPPPIVYHSKFEFESLFKNIDKFHLTAQIKSVPSIFLF